ncbi:hypothetical protein Gohar_018616 [Gossypium harknessii]|uniref:Uncharacterized protein n=1 Tax=Gossypium harknessii TaxID=34285 RepID=A0A7J9G9L1_9ROSI|nr:hypothetical protein [Gossypium harknessii]
MSEEYGARLSSLLVARDERKSGKLKRLGILGRVTSEKAWMLTTISDPGLTGKIFDQVGRASINLYFAMAECIDGCPHANYDLSKKDRKEGWGGYIHARVRMDVTKLLCRVFKFKSLGLNG